MATIIVENGDIIVGANSYVTEAELATYAADRGITLTGTPAVLLIQSMDYIEAQLYKGQKATEGQGTQWPRTGVRVDGYYVDSATIPAQLKTAQLSTAIAIDAGRDPLSTPDQTVKKEKVGDIEVEYQDGAERESIDRTINAALRKLLSGGSGGNMFAVSRG